MQNDDALQRLVVVSLGPHLSASVRRFDKSGLGSLSQSVSTRIVRSQRTLRDVETDYPVIQSLVSRIYQLDEHLVRPGRETGDHKRLTARVEPVPRRIVHRYVNVTDTRRNFQSCRAEDLLDADVFRSILDDDTPVLQRIGQ